MAETDLWALERACLAEGLTPVCGCDEAGAGPLAGPVYAAAVILPFGLELPGLDDSKKLTEKKREALFPLIQERAIAWAVARVESREIDETDILSARMKAMQLAIEPGPREVGGCHHAPQDSCKGGFPVGLHRSRLHPGQGEPGPLHDGGGRRPLPPVRVRPAQGLRHQAAL